MKKLKILNCILGLLLGLFPSLVNGKNAICEMKAPASCYRAVAIASGTGQQRKEGGSAPLKHCKTSADTDRLFGLKDGSVLSAVSTSLNVDDVATKSGMRKLQQALLISCKDHPNKSCAPTDGEEVAENNANPVNGALKIKCNPDLLSDGKYGICTAEAVRRYIEYIKATTKKCDSEITVTLTPPSGDIIENKDTVIEVVATKSGDVYTWDNKTEFTTKKMDSIVLENAHFTVVDHDDIAIDNQDITVGTPTKISGKFPAGEIKIKVNEAPVKEKPVLKSVSTPVVFDVKKLENPKNISCKQLLPKYLIGARCDNKLHGDARDITYWIQRFSGQITSFIAAFAILMIAWNAFGLVMASGDSDKIATNKKALMWIGIGLLLTIFAYVIVKTIISLSFLK